MQLKLMEILVCPKCEVNLDLIDPVENADEIIEGVLHCRKCARDYQIKEGIPRFVEDKNYAASFGYQWNLFRKEQIDSHNGTDLSAQRFWHETGWDRAEMKGKWILDAGCGAGRFIDAATDSEADVIGVDISNAVDAAKKNLGNRRNAHFVQASIYELPFRAGTFDNCYCIGVIQHTPDPEKTMTTLAKMLKTGGKLAVTIYERRKFTRLYSKYWLRPLTSRMPQTFLLNLIKGSMTVFFPLTNFLFHIPKAGKVFSFLIPIANYVSEPKLSKDQRYKWAVLDTFDMLAPAFDQPQTEEEARAAFAKSGVAEIKRLPNAGLNLTGVKIS